MGRYEIPMKMKKYIRRVLYRSFYEVRIEKHEKDTDKCYVLTNAGEDVFKKVYDRAYCEMMSEKDDVLYVTEREAADPFFTNILMETNKRYAVNVIKP